MSADLEGMGYKQVAPSSRPAVARHARRSADWESVATKRLNEYYLAHRRYYMRGEVCGARRSIVEMHMMRDRAQRSEGHDDRSRGRDAREVCERCATY